MHINRYNIDKKLEYMLSFVYIDVQTLNHEFTNIRQRITSYQIPNYFDNHIFSKNEMLNSSEKEKKRATKDHIFLHSFS